MARVLVFDYKEPRQKLMTWFVAESGVSCTAVDNINDLRHALLQNPGVLILNSTAGHCEIGELVRAIRELPGGDLRIVALHDGSHHEDETPVPADICLHSVRDIDILVAVVRSALDHEVPHATDAMMRREIIE